MNKELKHEAIETEISIWEGFFAKYESDFSELEVERNSKLDRIDVLEALGNVLPSGNSRTFNSEDLRDMTTEVSDLNKQMRELERKLQHSKTMLEGLSKLNHR